ncbi:hypothetical protein FACS1894111_08520 [Clostridia bacterium]|nr:hypothetical protein FACS1894111_08520 [Clostridia bacterium]
MKKMSKIITLLFAVLLLSVVVVGCGKKADSGKDLTVVEDPNNATSPVTNNPKLEQVAEEAQSQIADLKSAFGDTMDIEILVNGDILVYKYTYTQDVGDVAAAKASLETASEAAAASFEGIAANLKTLGVENGSVQVVYLNHDGTVIYQTEYK